MIDTACSRCGTEASPLYLYIEGVGNRCPACEKAWREWIAPDGWAIASVLGRDKAKPVPKDTQVVRSGQEVLL